MRTRIVFCIFLLFVLVSCVESRDYLGAKEGAVGLDIKKDFGRGQTVKDYFVTEDRIGIIKNDTKNEIIAKLGYPTNISTTLDGYDLWVYEKRGLELFFNGDYLDGWKKIENK